MVIHFSDQVSVNDWSVKKLDVIFQIKFQRGIFILRWVEGSEQIFRKISHCVLFSSIFTKYSLVFLKYVEFRCIVCCI